MAAFVSPFEPSFKEPNSSFNRANNIIIEQCADGLVEDCAIWNTLQTLPFKTSHICIRVVQYNTAHMCTHMKGKPRFANTKSSFGIIHRLNFSWKLLPILTSLSIYHRNSSEKYFLIFTLHNSLHLTLLLEISTNPNSKIHKILSKASNHRINQMVFPHFKWKCSTFYSLFEFSFSLNTPEFQHEKCLLSIIKTDEQKNVKYCYNNLNHLYVWRARLNFNACFSSKRI